MKEIFFDTAGGGVMSLIDETVNDNIQSQLQPVTLGSLLLSEHFPFQVGDYPVEQVDGWTRQECLNLGSLALMAMKQETGEHIPINTQVLKRLHTLGLGPYPFTYIRAGGRFTDMRAYRAAVGSLRGERDNYADWTPQKIIERAREIDARVDGKPKNSDYSEARRKGDFPSRPTITRIVGGIGMLNEHLGYPDVPSWNDDDLINFGVHFVELNGVEMLKRASIDLLSSQSRGPSYSWIHVKFQGWGKYKEKVQEKIQARAAQLDRYRDYINNGTMPKESAELSDDELRHIGAVFDVLGTLFPDLPAIGKRKIARATSYDMLINAIKRFRGDSLITAAELEVTAEYLGLFDDIFPKSYPYKEFITINDEDLEPIRIRKRAEVHDYSKRKRGRAAR
jgi:hypothetical protein